MDFLKPVWETLHISFFVVIVMMLMEYTELYRMRRRKGIGFLDKGESDMRSFRYYLQLLMAVFLGVIPGCVGGFLVVSLYAHRMLSFGAVLAASFTALGDDAFRMFAMAPMETFRLEAILLVMGLVAGFLVDMLWRRKFSAMPGACHIELHACDAGHHCHHHPGEGHRHGHKDDLQHDSRNHPDYQPVMGTRSLFTSWSLSKVLLLVMIGIYIIAMLGGVHLHSHEHIHGEVCTQSHGFTPDFEHLLFLGMSVLAFVLVLFSHEHFLQEHLWNHLLRKHFPSIFLWTLGTLYLIEILNYYIDLEAWLSGDVSRLGLMLVLAVLIGWIPQSGPHFLFIQLYYEGTIPFAVFFANSIVQDGHTSLLLLAESRGRYVWLKTIKSVVAVSIGLILLIGR